MRAPLHARLMQLWPCVLVLAGEPIDPSGPPARPGTRHLSVLRRRVSDEPSSQLIKTAIFGMGRFWCAEPVFARLPGVVSTMVGYTGGWTDNPTWEEVMEGNSGHAMAVRVQYDPGHIIYKMLLDVFLDAHDTTAINRQGSDVGNQFRSSIWYPYCNETANANCDQDDLAEKETTMDAIWNERPGGSGYCDTIMEARVRFWPAEEKHQRYLEKRGQRFSKGALDPIQCERGDDPGTPPRLQDT